MLTDMKHRILIVDDTPENIRVLMDLLRDQYTIAAATSGKRALEIAGGASPPDLILLDVLMPDMSGFEVCAELKSNQHTAGIPVIFITGLSNAADEQKGLELGVVDYINKPFTPALVLARIRIQLELKQHQNHLEELVAMRTQDLAIVNCELEEEIGERQKVQEALHLAKEQAEKGNRAKSAFLANMSHELRTPLNGIVGMMQLLSMTDPTEEQMGYLVLMKQTSDNLLALINDILDVTNIEADRLQLVTAGYSLRDCINQAISKQQKLLEEKKLVLTVDIPDTISDRVKGDRRRMSQILSNLLSNAIKFTSQGGITVTIRESDASPGLLDIAVSDSGIGIEKEHLGHIFDIFTQVDESFTRPYGGAGLGLAINRKLAELMGGSICVESSPGNGSTFHLLLPCCAEAVD